MSGSNTVSRPTEAPGAEPSRLLKALTLLCRLALAAVFLMAGVTKVTDLHGFEDRVLLLSRLPESLSLAVARCLPWLELTCGTCLALGYAVREAALIVSVLLLAFLGFHLLNPAGRGCDCFLFPRPVSSAGPWWPPVRDGFLLLCAVHVTLTRIAPSPPAPQQTHDVNCPSSV
jgi:uncharacterized membrane protein YphA (DoxX/SURF4 family)